MTLCHQMHLEQGACHQHDETIPQGACTIAVSCMRRLGISKETCHMMFKTLQQAKNLIRMSCRDSANSYKVLQIPLQGQGVLQGNRARPAIWLVASVLIINVLKVEGCSIHTEDTPITRKCFHHVCHTFVDNTDLVHMSSDDEADCMTVTTEMQQMMDCWEGGICTSGGALVPEPKSCWCFFSFK